jgi:hypothetical protein
MGGKPDTITESEKLHGFADSARRRLINAH